MTKNLSSVNTKTKLKSPKLAKNDLYNAYTAVPLSDIIKNLFQQGLHKQGCSGTPLFEVLLAENIQTVKVKFVPNAMCGTPVFENLKEAMFRVPSQI